MADIRLKLLAEIENVENVLHRLPDADSLPALSELEIAGVAALLHSFYNGIENILKHACAGKRISIPDGAMWHRELLNASTNGQIVSRETTEELIAYLAFRHFFSHGYAMDLDSERIKPLVANARRIFSMLKTGVARAFGWED